MSYCAEAGARFLPVGEEPGGEELIALASIGPHGKTQGMANRPINDKQRQVLDWLATGETQDPPTPEMKLSAAALKSRGLVKVRRPQGKWTCELTDLGEYYVEHWAYPPDLKEPAKESSTGSGSIAKKPKEKAPKVSASPSLRTKRPAFGSPSPTRPCAHLDLSPVCREVRPTARDRHHYRQFEKSLEEQQESALVYALQKRP